VKIVARDPGRPAAFEEVQDRVRFELTVERRHAAIAQFLQKAFARYQVDIDGAPVTTYAPTERLALRSAPSAED
jgi:hypothetical protein